MRHSYISPNFDERTGGAPDMILLHYTGMHTAEAALERLCDPAAKVSAHYVITEDGTLHALVPEDKRAWHAGMSYWAGERDINSRSIGIELVNGGHEFGYAPFPEAQIAALITLCRNISARYTIPPARVLGHSDVAPRRKLDPGHLFPWKTLAEQGIGLCPEINHTPSSCPPPFVILNEVKDLDLAKRDPSPLAQDDRTVKTFHAALLAYGYDPEASPEDVIIAFHRHFCPERFTSWYDRPDTPDAHSWERLALLELWK